jgi:hypothetical protein
MKIGLPPLLRRSLSVATIGILIAVLTSCTGRGGGYLPSDGVVFAGPASFGFDFSCRRSSRSTSPNPPAGQLRIQLSYTDHGSNPIGSSFSIHGMVDRIEPVLESMICIGQNPPEPYPNELIFLGRYRLTASAPAGFPRACRGERPTELCRFEVIVRDNDSNLAPSPGDFFSIKLSTVTDELITEFDPTTVFYARAGLLQGGNITVN